MGQIGSSEIQCPPEVVQEAGARLALELATKISCSNSHDNMAGAMAITCNLSVDPSLQCRLWEWPEEAGQACSHARTYMQLQSSRRSDL